MLYIRNDSLDPHFNLALEEYALKELEPAETVIMLWQNQPSIIIGRFQNTLQEINQEYVKAHGLHVVRRITGGGAVYHDLGNLNFTFIENKDAAGIDFRRFTEPIVQALRQLGIEAQHSGRNDITIGEKKFSGNAQYNYRGRTLHHGTILYESKLEDVQAALNVSAVKIESKGVKSVRSRVTNISEFLREKMEIRQFRDHLLSNLFGGSPLKEYSLTEQDLQGIRELMNQKYLTWDWNFGQSPAFNQLKSGRFPCGCIEVGLVVEKGIIRECRIFGDFFSNAELTELTALLQGTKHEAETIRKALTGQDLTKFFGPVDLEEFLTLF